MIFLLDSCFIMLQYLTKSTILNSHNNFSQLPKSLLSVSDSSLLSQTNVGRQIGVDRLDLIVYIYFTSWVECIMMKISWQELAPGNLLILQDSKDCYYGFFWRFLSQQFVAIVINISAKESSRSDWGSNPRPTATPLSTKYDFLWHFLVLSVDTRTDSPTIHPSTCQLNVHVL
jgi:hypothetical protein